MWSDAWTDFIFCFFLGYFGVHKFREKNTNMGILYLCTLGLCGIGWFVDIVRYFIAAYKGERIQGNRPKHLSADEPLPIVSSNVILSNGEVCHYCEAAIHIKTKNVVVSYSRESYNNSISTSKRKSMSLVDQRTTPIGSNVQERTNGVLSITNTRIVFSGNNCAFDKKITALSSITPYKDGIAFQFGSQQQSLLTRDSEYIYEILTRIINSSEDV